MSEAHGRDRLAWVRAAIGFDEHAPHGYVVEAYLGHCLDLAIEHPTLTGLVLSSAGNMAGFPAFVPFAPSRRRWERIVT